MEPAPGGLFIVSRTGAPRPDKGGGCEQATGTWGLSPLGGAGLGPAPGQGPAGSGCQALISPQSEKWLESGALGMGMGGLLPPACPPAVGHRSALSCPQPCTTPRPWLRLSVGTGPDALGRHQPTAWHPHAPPRVGRLHTGHPKSHGPRLPSILSPRQASPAAGAQGGVQMLPGPGRLGSPPGCTGG